MLSSYYNDDVITWSPQGRLMQVEYAMEAVKQGSVSIACRNKTQCVLIELKRLPNMLSEHQEKILKIDNHIGVIMSGLSSDLHVLGSFMRTEALNEKLTFDRPISLYKLVNAVSDKIQASTQTYGGRPYGVGFLLVGCDETGPHLYECMPTGDYNEYHAMSIGARSQPARTYLERNLDKYIESDLDTLILHGIAALNESLAQDMTLNSDNTSIAVISVETQFTLCGKDVVDSYLNEFNLRKSTHSEEGADSALRES